MHGRLRVKTSAQQEAERAAERDGKCAKYQQLSATVLAKYKQCVYDEQTMLQMGQLLAVNPDFYTLWNYRRKTFLHWRETKELNYLLPMLRSDLQFTEQCLGVNPKSYPTWHHRCWLLEQMPQPDWEAEIKLCDLCLKLDARNFHCWDYRRFCVTHTSRSVQSELAASDQLINRNLSNYSSWHYRSHLLSQLYPIAVDSCAPDCASADTPVSATDSHHVPSSANTSADASDVTYHGCESTHRFGCRLPPDVFAKELQLVENAAFTDPNDQAPWFYYRWLFGPAMSQEPSSAALASSPAASPAAVNAGSHTGGLPLCISLDDQDGAAPVVLLLLLLADPVTMVSRDCAGRSQTPPTTTAGTGTCVVSYTTLSWRSVDNADYDRIWMCAVQSDCVPAAVSLPTGGHVPVVSVGQLLSTWPPSAPQLVDSDGAGTAGASVSSGSIGCALDNLNQLAEIEPDNKWVFLTQLTLLRRTGLSDGDPGVATTIYTTLFRIVDRLIELDNIRIGYYMDLKSELMIERALLAYTGSGGVSSSSSGGFSNSSSSGSGVNSGSGGVSNSNSGSGENSGRTLSLASLGLTAFSARDVCLPPLPPDSGRRLTGRLLLPLLLQHLDVSHNRLSRLDLRPLLLLRSVTANNNRLRQLQLPATAGGESSSSCCRLQRLQLANNCLIKCADLFGGDSDSNSDCDSDSDTVDSRHCCASLLSIDLTNNSVVADRHQMALVARCFANATLVT